MSVSIVSGAREDLSARLKNWSKLLPHALLTALLMFTLDHLGWLDWLERATIEMAAATSSMMPRVTWRPAHQSASTYEDNAPRAVLIDEAAFQSDFRERTPLDRNLLSRVIAGIVEERPRILAIDIDLSPVSGASEAEATAQAALDELLIRAASSVRVILVTPFPTSLPERARVNANWMRKLCSQGSRLAFAYSYVARNQGVVTKIHPTFPSLGNAVYEHWRNDDSGKDACTALSGDGYPAYLDEMFVHSVTAPLRDRDALVPLNVNFFEEGLATRMSYPLSDGAPKSLDGRVVFLGTDVHTMDNLITASGGQPGVLVHAATFFTRVHPVALIPHWLLFIIETLLGVLLLRAFSWLWRRYFEDLDVPPSTRSLWRQASAVLVASRWSAAVVALAALVSVISVAMSGFLLAQATWFNFAPIAIAAAVKAKETAAQAQTHELEEKLAKIEQRHTPRSRSALRRGIALLLKHPWLTMLALCALILAIAY